MRHPLKVLDVRGISPVSVQNGFAAILHKFCAILPKNLLITLDNIYIIDCMNCTKRAVHAIFCFGEVSTMRFIIGTELVRTTVLRRRVQPPQGR